MVSTQLKDPVERDQSNWIISQDRGEHKKHNLAVYPEQDKKQQKISGDEQMSLNELKRVSVFSLHSPSFPSSFMTCTPLLR